MPGHAQYEDEAVVADILIKIAQGSHEPSSAQSTPPREPEAMLTIDPESVTQPSGSSRFSCSLPNFSWKSFSEIHNSMTDRTVPVHRYKYCESAAPLDADENAACQRLAEELYNKGLRVDRDTGSATTTSCIATAAGHLWHSIKESSSSPIDNETVEKEVQTLIKLDSQKQVPWLDKWIVLGGTDWAMGQTQ